MSCADVKVAERVRTHVRADRVKSLGILTDRDGLLLVYKTCLCCHAKKMPQRVGEMSMAVELSSRVILELIINLPAYLTASSSAPSLWFAWTCGSEGTPAALSASQHFRTTSHLSCIARKQSQARARDHVDDISGYQTPSPCRSSGTLTMLAGLGMGSMAMCPIRLVWLCLAWKEEPQRAA